MGQNDIIKISIRILECVIVLIHIKLKIPTNLLNIIELYTRCVHLVTSLHGRDSTRCLKDKGPTKITALCLDKNFTLLQW